jgi:hypothetical protein
MVRSEAKTIICAPKDEQAQIDLMSRFYWRLLSTQEVRQLDSHIERRGENLYSVTRNMHYVKLAFQRERNIPHYEMIKKLEKDYNALPIPKFPKIFPWSNGSASGCLLWVMVLLLWPVSLPLWILYMIFIYPLNRSKAKREYNQLIISRQEIMERLDYIEGLEAA